MLFNIRIEFIDGKRRIISNGTRKKFLTTKRYVCFTISPEKNAQQASMGTGIYFFFLNLVTRKSLYHRYVTDVSCGHGTNPYNHTTGEGGPPVYTNRGIVGRTGVGKSQTTWVGDPPIRRPARCVPGEAANRPTFLASSRRAVRWRRRRRRPEQLNARRTLWRVGTETT